MTSGLLLAPEEVKAEKEKDADEKKDSSEKSKKFKRMSSIDEHGFSKKLSELKAAFRVQRYCVHTICEHDEVLLLIL